MSNTFIPPTNPKTLIIAEKAKQIPAIVAALPKPHKVCRGFTITGGGVVTSLVGHILEQAKPEEYDEKLKKWDLDLLPIKSPKQWINKPTSGKFETLKLIKTLLATSTDVIHAGDPGREGQLIVDEVLIFLKNKLPVRRIEFPETNLKSVMNAFNNIRPNEDFKDLLEAALCRQHADYLLGMNLTRLFTKRAQTLGYRDLISLGRVQTPTLGLLVDRENEIRNFIPKDFLKINAHWNSSGKAFKTIWNARKGQAGMDASGRLIDKAICDGILAKVKKENQGVVTKNDTVRAQEDHPLPHEIISMYGAMDTQMRSNTDDTLAAMQSLYDQGYMSYPRTDNPYYSVSKHAEAPAIIGQLIAMNSEPEIAGWASKADPSIMSKSWNDNPKPGKVIEHTGLSPTEVVPNFNSLSQLEQAVYKEVVRRYLAQFYPHCEVDKSTLVVESAQEDFITRGRVVVIPGWRAVINNLEDDSSVSDDDENSTLPPLKIGDVVDLKDIVAIKDTTKPPQRYTVKTLLAGMKDIHKTVTDPNAKKLLKNVEGIGTAATSGNILTTLTDRRFMEKQKRYLVPTEMGMWVIKSAPDRAKSPVLTAQWESALDAVASGKVPGNVFEEKLNAWIEKLVADCKISPLDAIPEKALKESQARFEKKFGGSNTKKAGFKGKSGTAGAKGKGGKPVASGSSVAPVKSGFSAFNNSAGTAGNRGFGGIKKDVK